jgi:DNA-binding MarR family transcriptional regulator
VMEILSHEGPKHQMEISRRFRSSKQSMGFVIRRLESKGWVRRVAGTLPASRTEESEKMARRAKRRGKKIAGRRVLMVRLTAEGKKWIAWVFPKHAKVVKSYMLALEGREQQTLKRLCDKLREGNIVRFCKEIRRVDFADEELTSGDLRLGGGDH